MSLWPFAEAVTIHRLVRDDEDDDGNDTWTESDIDAHAALYPLESSELTDARDTSTQRINAVFVPAITLLVTDEITARSGRWEVDAEAGQYHSPLTHGQVTKAVLKKVTG